jgi:hypothetical protein
VAGFDIRYSQGAAIEALDQMMVQLATYLEAGYVPLFNCGR